MKRLFYGVAVSALVIGAGGAAVACEKHNHSAALKNPASATQAATMRGILLAQTQSDEKKTTTTGEEEKKDKSEALPSRSIGPMAQSQDDADKEKKTDEEKKPEATPGRAGNMVLAQAQSDEQSGTSGQGSSDEDSKPDEQKDE
ncbi:MAG: hypothetical protein P8Z80_18445 [Pseudolabrys sp.]